MPKAMKKLKRSHARLSPFLKGLIYGMWLAGSTVLEIAEEVEKPDGSTPTVPTIRTAIKTCEENGGVSWDGGAENHGGGRPRKGTDSLDQEITKLVTRYRGQAKVTSAFLKKMIPAARALSARTIRRRLADAGLRWLLRRRKSLVPSVHKAARIEWAWWVLQRTVLTLSCWGYTDGTVFFLARCLGEQEDSLRGGLGCQVWRQSCGSDALYEDCVGPSSYWKGQGAMVRFWGLLVNGILFIYVLPTGERMNRWWYEWLILTVFPKWIAKAVGARTRVFLVQDHERALWTKEPVQAMKKVNIELLENYPKCSQDLNPIETAWKELRERLAHTEPRPQDSKEASIRKSMESRDVFIKRLRNAVVWLNKNRASYFGHLCLSQKSRAQAWYDSA
jgi:hypothetical protein